MYTFDKKTYFTTSIYGTEIKLPCYKIMYNNCL